MKNVPKLRFKDDNGRDFPSWEEKRLGDLGVFQGGGTPSTTDDRYWNGIVPWISSSDLNENSIHEISINRFISNLAIKESATKLIQKNSLLIVSRVGVGKLAVTIDKVCTSQDFTNFTPQSDNVFYLAYYLFFHKIKLISFSQGTSIKGFTKDDISSLIVQLPCLKEQEKIANFLTAVDDRISQISQKCDGLAQYKKGMMQKIFSQELRFKDEKGRAFPAWEEKRLGECLDYIQPTKYLVSSTEYDDSFETPVLTAGKTFILGYTNEKNDIFTTGLPVIIFDDFTTATQFVDFPFKAKSSAMKILVATKNVNIKFIYGAMQVLKYEVGGHERHWISKFSNILLPIPSMKEQEKIAGFLGAVDAKISQAQAQRDALKQYKQGLLQQMFV